MQDSPYRHLIAADWQEQPEKIRTIMADVQLFDSRRGQDFQKTFPEIAEFYRRYL
jgi:hypothetical protein